MDLSHQFGSDLTLSPSGDLASADGAAVTQQRVLRRLLTNTGSYIWHLAYGAGLPGFVGQAADQRRIRAVILRQMRFERGVGTDPAPTVDVTVGTNSTVTARIRYADQDGTLQQIVANA